MMEVTWPIIKDFLDQRHVPVQWIDISEHYHIFASDGPFNLFCKLYKLNDSDGYITEFETQYKPYGNKDLGAIPVGWRFRLRCFEFETSKLSSLRSQNFFADAYTDISLVLKKANGDAIGSQGLADTDCVQTAVDLEPAFDYRVVGGLVQAIEKPTVDVYGYNLFAPDIPLEYGGQFHNVDGFNFAFATSLRIDGRVAGKIEYDPTYHSGKMGLRLFHPAGHKTRFQVVLETYEAIS